MTSVNNIKFWEPKQSGKFEKISITDSNREEVTVETEHCFSWGVQKSDKFESYSLPLVFKNGSETLKRLKEIIQRYNEHSPPEKKFSKCLYENPKLETTTIYPKIKYFKGNFNTTIYEKDVEINPHTYLNVKCDARALIHIEGILIGDKTSLLMRVLEVEVSEPKELSARKRLLSKKS